LCHQKILNQCNQSAKLLKIKQKAYPLLHQYFNELCTTKNKIIIKQAFSELFSYLYNNIKASTSISGLAHDDRLLNKILSMTESGLALFAKSDYAQFKNKIQDMLILTCLGSNLDLFHNNYLKMSIKYTDIGTFVLGQLYFFNLLDPHLRDNILFLINIKDNIYEIPQELNICYQMLLITKLKMDES
jgi:hypothetical protein